MIVRIEDDFNLHKIIASGQCFRAKEIRRGLFRFITGMDVLYIREKSAHQYETTCNTQQWDTIWAPFFSLETNYSEIRKTVAGKHPFIDLAINEGLGLRVLRQDPWEMLISFIISQRKSIPAISKSVNMMAEKFGTKIITEYEQVNAFPSPFQLAEASSEMLSGCSLGYRTPYVLDAIHKISSQEMDLNKLRTLDDDHLRQQLMQIRGVGPKVANCICLFGYGRTGAVPVDVWIRRAIDNECFGRSPFEDYGAIAGIIQQYVFFYEKNHQQ